jgi:hypothetical protein
MAVMAITLPYEFDTSGVVKQIMGGVLGLLLVVLAGVFYSLLVSHSIAATLQLLLIAAIATYFGRIFLRNLTGTLGTPDILIARTHLDAGRIVGNELAAALKLPYQEEDFPY